MLASNSINDEGNLKWMREYAQDQANLHNVPFVIFNREESCSGHGYTKYIYYTVRRDELSKWQQDPKNQIETVQPTT